MVRRRQAAAHMGTFLLSSQGDIFIESRQFGKTTGDNRVHVM
jgi:hypothetical protein